MSPQTSPPTLPPSSGRIPRAAWHTIGLVMAGLIAWLIWRGYQSPDFLLDLAAFRIC